MQAGAYAAVMLAVLGVPQVLYGFIDQRARRQDQRENKANSERRHRESLAAEERREERRRDAELSEQSHREMMALLIAALNNRGHQDNGQSELIRSLQQTIANLEAENARLRQQNGEGSHSTSA